MQGLWASTCYARQSVSLDGRFGGPAAAVRVREANGMRGTIWVCIA